MATQPKAPPQAELALPQPQYGGSYIRHADGGLELVERTEDHQPPTPGEAAPQAQQE